MYIPLAIDRAANLSHAYTCRPRMAHAAQGPTDRYLSHHYHWVPSQLKHTALLLQGLSASTLSQAGNVELVLCSRVPEQM